jgi:hypothetical protein
LEEQWASKKTQELFGDGSVRGTSPVIPLQMKATTRMCPTRTSGTLEAAKKEAAKDLRDNQFL